MRTPRNRTGKPWIRVLGTAAWLAFSLGSNPVLTRADDSGVSADRFQIELFGGLQGLNPRDLNLRSESDTAVQEFQFDSFLQYGQAQGSIDSWYKIAEGTRGRIKVGIPAGFRVKYRLSRSISVSLGLAFLRAEASDDILFEYESIETSSLHYQHILDYAPYALSLSAWMPRVACHYEKQMSGRWGLEGYVAAGPTFASCRTYSNLNYSWHMRGSDFDWLAFTQVVRLEEKGSGTGLGLETAARLNYRLTGHWGLYLAAGYAYQKIRPISGEGSDLRDRITQTWEGTWAIKSDRIIAPWGELAVRYPTAYWPQGSANQKIRDFVLDLSGFQLTLGVFYRF